MAGSDPTRMARLASRVPIAAIQFWESDRNSSASANGQPCVRADLAHGSENEVRILDNSKSISKGIEHCRDANALAHIAQRL